MQYSGYASSFDDVHIDGNVDELKFVAYYSKNNKILAASSMNVPSSMQIINEAMRLNLMPTASEIKNGSVTLKDIQNKIVAAGSRSSCGKAGCCKNKNWFFVCY